MEKITLIALVVNAVAVYLLSKYGNHPVKPSSQAYLYTEPENKEKKPKEDVLYKKYRVRRNIGLVLAILSIALLVWVELIQ